MRVHGFIVGLAAALAAGVAACGSSTAPSDNGGTGSATGGGTPGTSGDTITASSTTTGGGAYGSGGNYFFSPTADTVAAGRPVTYVFGSVIHNVHFSAVAGAPDSISATSNTAVSRTFPTAGTYNYMCTIHHFSGVVVVH